MLGKARDSGKSNGDTPTDFNDCVSKNELRVILDDKLNEILQQITNLAKRIEDVEQRYPEPRPEDDDNDLSEEEDGDAEAEAKAQRRAEDAPTYFNDCVSKNELRAILDDKFNEILQQITNLAKRIEDVE